MQAASFAMYLAERAPQVREQVLEITCRCLVGAADQDIVPAGLSVVQQDKTRGFPQAALGAVASDGVADLFGTRVADAQSDIFIAAIVRLQQK